MKWRESKWLVRPKPVPPTYRPVGNMQYGRYVYDSLPEAVTAFIVGDLPPKRRSRSYVLDEIGAIILGWSYRAMEQDWLWYGTTEAFEIVQAHPAIDSFAALEWEQKALSLGYVMP